MTNSVAVAAATLPFLYWQAERLPYNGRAEMKIVDLTQFYSPLSGGVKRYLHEKIDFIEY